MTLRINNRKVFFTYGKTGRITRHRLLRSALIVAQAQALKGRDAYVDQFNGKFTRTVRFFPRKAIREMLKAKRSNPRSQKLTRMEIKGLLKKRRMEGKKRRSKIQRGRR